MSHQPKRPYPYTWDTYEEGREISDSRHGILRQRGHEPARLEHSGFDQRNLAPEDQSMWSERYLDHQPLQSENHERVRMAPPLDSQMYPEDNPGILHPGGHYRGRGLDYDHGGYHDQGLYPDQGRYPMHGPPRAQEPGYPGASLPYHGRQSSFTHDNQRTPTDDFEAHIRPHNTFQDTISPYAESGLGLRKADVSTSRHGIDFPGQTLALGFSPFLENVGGREGLVGDSKMKTKGSEKPHQSQRRANRDEFDGPVQFLDRPSGSKVVAQDKELPQVPISLDVREQDDVLRQVNTQLSRCAFDFVAKYQFPIPLEPGKRPVREAGDREWTEWAFLIKRLATKRRIPTRVLYEGQIKQLVTVLENSLEMRHASAHQSRPPKDDRNVLQLISAGIQVAKMLKDAVTMEYLDSLYKETERLIQERRKT